jgi:hypothetical protein
VTGRALALVASTAAPSSAPSPTSACLRAQARQVRAQLAALAAVADALDAQADALDVAPAPDAPSAQLVPPHACAAALGISIATLNRRVNEGIVPFVQIGDARRYDVAEVRAALAAAPSSTSTPRQLPPAASDSGPELVTASPAGVRRVSTGGKRGGR